MALMLTVFLLSSCSKSTEEAKSSEPAPRVEPAAGPVSQLLPQASATPTAAPAKKSAAAPDAADIRDAVARVFVKTATADTTSNSSFAVGDFNGDGSEDLAVAVKANEGALGDINNELANWILEDPRSVPIPGSTSRIPLRKRVRAEKGDALLAIIHGVGPQGWRAAEAKQTYLLKTGAGPKLLAQSPDEVRATSQKLPPLRGDVLSEAIGGKSGFVFWTGAKYSWWGPPAN